MLCSLKVSILGFIYLLRSLLPTLGEILFPSKNLLFLPLCHEHGSSSPQKKNANRNDVQFLILIVETLTWITVKTSKSLTARAGHVALFLPVEDEEKEKEEIAVFGGGDNAGGYFNDLVVFSPSTC